MSEFFGSSAYFGFFLTLGSFYLARKLNLRTGSPIFNPILFATIFCCIVLLAGNISYETYYIGARHIDMLLTPATICLAIPLYRQYELLKKNIPAILAGITAGVVVNILLTALIMLLFRLDHAAFISMLPRSITSAVGKSLSEELGGNGGITIVLILITGIFGAVVAPYILKLFRIHDPLAQGLAIGTSSHAGGTASAIQMGDIQGAASSLAIVVASLLSVILIPLAVSLV